MFTFLLHRVASPTPLLKCCYRGCVWATEVQNIFIAVCQCFDPDSIFFRKKNVCLLRIFCWKGWSNTDTSLINLCGKIPSAAFWTIPSFEELWVFVYLHICYGYAQTPMPSRKFYLQFCPLSILLTGCRGWWSLSCQSRFTCWQNIYTFDRAVRLLSPNQMSTHAEFPSPQTKLEGSASSLYSNLYLEPLDQRLCTIKNQERKTPRE